MALAAVLNDALRIPLAYQAFGVSQTYYRYQAKLCSGLPRIFNTTNSVNKKYGDPNPRQANKADLKRVPEERALSKRLQSTLPTTPSIVRLHS